MTIDSRFIRYYGMLCASIICLIALGAATRAMNAGLACPDWPLCFGDIIPDFHPQVYFEFIHRALAGLIALSTFFFNWHIFKNTKRKSLKILSVAIVLLLLAQIIMGGLTVLLQLKESVVATHLGLGTAFFALSYWTFLTLRHDYRLQNPGEIHNLKSGSREVYENSKNAFLQLSRYKIPAAVVILSVYCQIILGGLVASHYAANVCPTFPLCHGEFIPTLSGTIGLQVIHRLGAYMLSGIVISFVVVVMKTNKLRLFRGMAMMMLSALIMQITIGIANVLFLAPPLITVLHTIFATSLLAFAVFFLRHSTLENQVGSEGVQA